MCQEQEIKIGQTTVWGLVSYTKLHDFRSLKFLNTKSLNEECKQFNV